MLGNLEFGISMQTDKKFDEPYARPGAVKERLTNFENLNSVHVRIFLACLSFGIIL